MDKLVEETDTPLPSNHKSKGPKIGWEMTIEDRSTDALLGYLKLGSSNHWMRKEFFLVCQRHSCLGEERKLTEPVREDKRNPHCFQPQNWASPLSELVF